MAGRPVPGALNIGDGGGKEQRRLLGCGLEKRPPYPRQLNRAHFGKFNRARPEGVAFWHGCVKGGGLIITRA